MSSLEEEVKQIERAVERIMFDEIIKDIFGKEVKKCGAMSYENAYNFVILQAVPKVQDAVERHVSFKHIFDTNSKRLGLYDCPSFIQKLLAILDDRVERGIEVISGGKMGNDFDTQLRFALVRFSGEDAHSDREKFLRGPVKAGAKVDMQSQREKDDHKSTGEKVGVMKKNHDAASSPSDGSSNEISFMRARK